VFPLPLTREAPAAPISVLVCDPVSVRRRFVRELLEREATVAIIDEVDDLHGLAPAAEAASPDLVIVATAGMRITEAAVLAALRGLATRRILVLCDSDRREVRSGRVILLPPSIGSAGLRREVMAAGGTPPVRAADHLLCDGRLA
jgi:hypothetical protein